jgi:hypothetical protein
MQAKPRTCVHVVFAGVDMAKRTPKANVLICRNKPVMAVFDFD